jgi:hypothetical protein
VVMLIDYGCDVNQRGADGIAPLLIASAKGYTEIAAQLRAHGATDEGSQWMELTAQRFTVKDGGGGGVARGGGVAGDGGVASDSGVSQDLGGVEAERRAWTSAESVETSPRLATWPSNGSDSLGSQASDVMEELTSSTSGSSVEIARISRDSIDATSVLSSRERASTGAYGSSFTESSVAEEARARSVVGGGSRGGSMASTGGEQNTGSEL